MTHPLDAFFENIEPGKNQTGITVENRIGHDIVQVFAANGKTAQVEKALGIRQSPGKASVTGNFTALPVSPGQWLVVSAKPEPEGFAKGIAGKLKKNGHVSGQGGSRVILRLSGAKVRELMQKGCRLDLHPSVARKGFCAQTQMAQTGVLIHQVDDKPTYDLLIYSGFAHDFAKWLHHTGAQLGIRFSKSG